MTSEEYASDLVTGELRSVRFIYYIIYIFHTYIIDIDIIYLEKLELFGTIDDFISL